MAKVIWSEPALVDLKALVDYIVYLIRSDACYIVAVIHGSRDFLRHVVPGDWIIA